MKLPLEIRLALRLVLLTAISTIALFASVAPASAQTVDIPVLTWTQRSDWINVVTSINPVTGQPYGADPTGATDSTAAIQAALTRASRGYNSDRTVYIPAGTYKISNTLDWQGTNTPWTYGGSKLTLVGCGRNTVLQWYGASGQPMFWTKGATRTRYIGLAWDGRNIASCAYEACSLFSYEGRIRHQNESFRNFTVPGTYVSGETVPAAGIIAGIGPQTGAPDAEVMIWNCLFQNCTNGAIVGYEVYNNYQWEFRDCEFESCGTGIACGDGKTIILNNHFQGSTVSDITTGAGLDQTIKRCTSVGSKTFLTIGFGGSTTPQMVHDCWVDSWTGTGGAIQIGSRGPVCLLDVKFTNPPNANPPIVCTNSQNCPLQLMVSNIYCPTITNLINPGLASTTTTIPMGSRVGDVTSLSSPSVTFLQTTWPADSTHILDVTQPPYNAVGNGTTDDTAAIQHAINDAKAANNGSIVYLPSLINYNTFLVTSTLMAGGSNYKIQGSGLNSVITWGGPTSGSGAVVMNNANPQNVSLEQFSIHATPTVTEVLETSTGPGSAFYDGLYCYGMSGYNQDGSGLVLSNLAAGSQVYTDHLDSPLTVSDSGLAEILCNFTLQGRVIVNGATHPKTGFLGILDFQGGTVTNDSSHWDLQVDDNQDLVIGHWYEEQGYNHVQVSRGAATGTTPGRVTIEGVKQNFLTTGNTGISINNYLGRVMYGPTAFANTSGLPVIQTGTNAVDLILAADTFAGGAPVTTLTSACRLIEIADVISSGGTVTYPAPIMPTGAAASIAAGFDHQRQLGWEDLKMRYGIENVVTNPSAEADAANASPNALLGYTPAGWNVGNAVIAGAGARNTTVVSGASPFGAGTQSMLFLDTTAATTTGARLEFSQYTLPLPASEGAVLTCDFRLNPLTALNDDVWFRVFAGASTSMALHLSANSTGGAISTNVGGSNHSLVTLALNTWYRLRAVIQAPNSAGSAHVQLYLYQWTASGPSTVALYNSGVIDGLATPGTSGFSRVVFNLVGPGENTSINLDNVTLIGGDPLLN